MTRLHSVVIKSMKVPLQVRCTSIFQSPTIDHELPHAMFVFNPETCRLVAFHPMAFSPTVHVSSRVPPDVQNLSPRTAILPVPTLRLLQYRLRLARAPKLPIFPWPNPSIIPPRPTWASPWGLVHLMRGLKPIYPRRLPPRHAI